MGRNPGEETKSTAVAFRSVVTVPAATLLLFNYDFAISETKMHLVSHNAVDKLMLKKT